MLVLVLCMTTTATAFAASTTNTKLNLNGRSGPGTNYSIVIKIPPKSTVTTTGSTKNGFTQVKYNGKTCWVSSEYVDSVSNSSIGKTAYTTNTLLNLNMRVKASSSSKVVKKIPPQSKITIYGNKTSGFYYASYGGTKGYVSADYVSFSEPKPDDKEYYENKLGKKISSYSGLQCVPYVRNRATEKGYKISIYGNANQWWGKASNAGYKTGSTPKSNSIAVFNGGTYGHVIYVEYYDSSSKTIYFTENNCSSRKDGVLYKKSLSQFKKLNPGNFKGFIYLK